MFPFLIGGHTILDKILIMQIQAWPRLAHKNGKSEMMKGVLVGPKFWLLMETPTSKAKSEIDIEFIKDKESNFLRTQRPVILEHLEVVN